MGETSRIIRPNSNASPTRNNASIISFHPCGESFCLISVGIKIAVGFLCPRTPLIVLFMEYLLFLIWFFFSWSVVLQLRSAAAILISHKTSVVAKMPCSWVSLMSWGGIWEWGWKANVCGKSVLLVELMKERLPTESSGGLSELMKPLACPRWRTIWTRVSFYSLQVGLDEGGGWDLASN